MFESVCHAELVEAWLWPAEVYPAEGRGEVRPPGALTKKPPVHRLRRGKPASTRACCRAWTPARGPGWQEAGCYTSLVTRFPSLIRAIKTPRQAQAWLKSLAYNPADTMRGLHGVLKYKKAHCLEGALSIATILEARGYPPLILDLESADGLDHTLFLFREKGKYGAVGMSRDFGLHGRKPVFKTVRALAQSYVIPYIDPKARITAYGVFDLRTLKNNSWLTSEKNLWFVEDALREFPHAKITTSPRTIRIWRKKLARWKKKHPTTPFPYPNQKLWL